MRARWLDRSGVTATEYALIAALVALVIVVALTLVGEHVGGLHEGVAEEVVEVAP